MIELVIPQRRRDKKVKDMLGSHRRIRDILKSKGVPLQPLPFRGAVYRVGNAGSHSGTGWRLSAS